MIQISLPCLHSTFHNACPRYLKSRRDLLYAMGDFFNFLVDSLGSLGEWGLNLKNGELIPNARVEARDGPIFDALNFPLEVVDRFEQIQLPTKSGHMKWIVNSVHEWIELNRMSEERCTQQRMLSNEWSSFLNGLMKERMNKWMNECMNMMAEFTIWSLKSMGTWSTPSWCDSGSLFSTSE